MLARVCGRFAFEIVDGTVWREMVKPGPEMR